MFLELSPSLAPVEQQLRNAILGHCVRKDRLLQYLATGRKRVEENDTWPLSEKHIFGDCLGRGRGLQYLARPLRGISIEVYDIWPMGETRIEEYNTWPLGEQG